VVSLSLGLLISASSATAQEAVQKTVLLSIPTINLCGYAFPIRSMPMPVQWFVEILPATHYIRVSRAIYLRGAGLDTLWPEVLVICGFGFVLVASSLRRIGARA
jgi:ABC-2 type transport system permease protein